MGTAMFAVTISSAQLQAGTNQIMDETEWILDRAGNWIETGYGTFPGLPTQFYWGDNRSASYFTFWQGQYSTANVSASAPGTRNDYSISSNPGGGYAIKTAGWPATSPVALCATGFNGKLGIEVNDYSGSLSATPSCGGGSGFTAQQANFTSIRLNGTTPSNPPGSLLSPGSPIRTTWSGIPSPTLTAACP
jgi:hypothetical protein